MMKPKLLTSRVNPIILFLFQNTVDWTCPLHDHNIYDRENESDVQEKKKERQKEMNGWLNKQMRLPKMYVSLQFQNYSVTMCSVM